MTELNQIISSIRGSTHVDQLFWLFNDPGKYQLGVQRSLYFQKIAEQISPFYKDHPKIKEHYLVQNFDGRAAIDLSSIAVLLMSMLREYSNDEIPQKIDELLSIENAIASNYSLFSGLKLSEQIIITPELTIIPTQKLPNEAQKIMQDYIENNLKEFAFIDRDLLFVVVQKKAIDPVFVPQDYKHSMDAFKKISTEFNNIYIALTLSLPKTPFFHVSFSLFDDENLQILNRGIGYHYRRHTLRSRFSHMLLSDSSSLVELHNSISQLPTKMLDKLSDLNAHLQNASFENDIKQKALELSVVFEFIFADGNTEMAHKISTRTALLIENDVDERKSIRKIIKKLYAIRSKFVHGDGSIEKIKVTINKKELYAKDIVRESTRIAQETLKTIIVLGKFPSDKFALLDIGGKY